MADSDPDPETSGAAALKAEAERLRATGVLGRSGAMPRLFDHLLTCALAGQAAREIDLAIDVFGRAADIDLGQDAVVRVYIHKLRRRLDDHYERHSSPGGQRLTIPRGEYRLTLETVPVPEEEPAPTPASVPPPPASTGRTMAGRKGRWMAAAAAVAALLVVNGAGWMVYGRSEPGRAERLVEGSRLWGPIVSDSRPIRIVVGDYFIFGESEDGMNVNRLVREYDVDSPNELADYLSLHPEKVDRYVNLDLSYLPVASAFAIRDVTTLLVAGGADPERIRVSPVSALTPDMLRAENIIFVGYLSGLGLLRELGLDRSRFRIGETFDEIVDSKSGRHFYGEGGNARPTGSPYRDYGYVSALRGPGGNQILILAGTRDAGLRQIAEMMTRPASLKTLERATGSAGEMEALYEVQAVGDRNMAGRLAVAAPLGAAQ